MAIFPEGIEIVCCFHAEDATPATDTFSRICARLQEEYWNALVFRVNRAVHLLSRSAHGVDPTTGGYRFLVESSDDRIP